MQHHVLISVLAVLLFLPHGSTAEWLNHGADISNSRRAVDLKITPKTVSNLRLKWKFFAGMDISATPAVADGVIYVPSWNGFLYAVNAFNGKLRWKQNLSELTGLRGTGVTVNVTVSRATPTVTQKLLIVSIYGPEVVIAVTRSSGRLVWMTTLNPRPRAVITMSGTAYDGAFYVGISSLEIALPAGQCCTFRGSMTRLDLKTGAVQWQTYTIPDNGGQLGGYSGGAIWGSSPAIDTRRQLVYAGTGNLYTAPRNVTECQARQNNQTAPSGPDRCIGSDVHFDSIVAFEMGSGRIRWATQLGGYDIWYFACLVPNNPDCPPGPNVDADFSAAPMMMSVKSNGTRRDVAVAVQKSGLAWALDRDTGDIVWSTVSPCITDSIGGTGRPRGGGYWGAANDGLRVYTNIANSGNVNFTLAPSSQTTTAGAWVGLDANTGRILWTTANPSNETANAPVSVVNSVVFAGSVAPNGPIYAVDATNGTILWSYDTGATVYGGISIRYGCIYLGNGYTVGSARLFHPTWTAGKNLFAFCLW